jgi:hypothetical protein
MMASAKEAAKALATARQDKSFGMKVMTYTQFWNSKCAKAPAGDGSSGTYVAASRAAPPQAVLRASNRGKPRQDLEHAAKQMQQRRSGDSQQPAAVVAGGSEVVANNTQGAEGSGSRQQQDKPQEQDLVDLNGQP